MANTTEDEAKISIKVIVDKVNKRVVCAEVDYSFVDILFSFVTLPMGTIARLLGTHDDKKFECLGSFNNLYHSLKDLPERYLSTECKSMLLNPRSLSYDYCRNLELKIDDTEPIQYLVCNNVCCYSCLQFMSCINVSSKDNRPRRCQRCCCLMGFQESNWHSGVFEVSSSVFVSDTATFIVTDDLCVEPYNLARSIRLLTDLGITNINHIEERNLQISSYQVKVDCSYEFIIGMLYFLKLALSTHRPFTYFVFSRICPETDIFISWHHSISEYYDYIKREVSASSKMFLELSLQKSTGKLLFAEAKEDFVEFLFGFLWLPLGTVIGTLTKGASTSRCMENILRSISNMSVGKYLKTQDIKDMLLKPHFGQKYFSKNQIFPLNGVPLRSDEVENNDIKIDVGFLKQSGMFLVTDDLTITPSSLASSIDLLKKLEVAPEDIERCEVSISLKEGLSMLKESLRSSSILTKSLEHQLKR
ncbi:hypothetical protein Hdeb2414_s0297g00860121 [Helianthus debilis subsp. tardiflorus]